MPDEIEWLGNLDDDCTAFWRGLTLRAENMGKWWWWAVYVWAEKTSGRAAVEVASCYENDDEPPRAYRTGAEARKAAEDAARAYLGKKEG